MVGASPQSLTIPASLASVPVEAAAHVTELLRSELSSAIKASPRLHSGPTIPWFRRDVFELVADSCRSRPLVLPCCIHTKGDRMTGIVPKCCAAPVSRPMAPSRGGPTIRHPGRSTPPTPSPHRSAAGAPVLQTFQTSAKECLAHAVRGGSLLCDSSRAASALDAAHRRGCRADLDVRRWVDKVRWVVPLAEKRPSEEGKCHKPSPAQQSPRFWQPRQRSTPCLHREAKPPLHEVVCCASNWMSSNGFNVDRLSRGRRREPPRLPLPLGCGGHAYCVRPRSTRKTARAMAARRMRCGTAKVGWCPDIWGPADPNPLNRLLSAGDCGSLVTLALTKPALTLLPQREG